MNVIVWSQDSGILAVCIPSGNVPIEDVIRNDVPSNVVYRVVDSSVFPVSLDDVFFDSVRLVNDEFVLDIESAKSFVMDRTNDQARVEYRRRSENSAIGIPNDPDDATWLSALNAKRSSITNATTINELRNLL